MIAHDPNSLCRQAELYYYDFLCNESYAHIPESVIDHIEQCQHCQEQINKLKAVLSQAEGFESQQRRVSSAVTTMLKLHFAYIGKPVTCNIVKPFLPSLLDQVLGMRIPTPIVTHLCDCQQCFEDLDVIRCLNLNRKQLCRLSQLFAEKPPENNISCSKAQNAIPSVVSMVFSKTDSEVLKHLCKCPVCRGLLYKERQKMCDSMPEYAQSVEFPCESVSASDIFDYVVLYGLDPVNDEYAKFRKSFVSHVATCPNCLDRMQQLHKTVYNIAERAESEVVTIYDIDESAKAQATRESDDLYGGFPVKVEVIKHEDEVEAEPSDSTINFGVALKRRIATMNLKPLLKPAIAAAAVILIAVALFFSIPTARAVTIDQIYKAVERVKNVYISKSVPNKPKPTEEKWVSRTLNIHMTKTGKQLVLWDLSNKVRKAKQLGTDSVATTSLSGDIYAEIEKRIRRSFGLMPFYDISEIPQDAKWSRVTDYGLKATAEGTDAYDLAWVEKGYDGSAVFKKWRVFADAETNLPQKVEWYEKLPADSEYILDSVMVVEYLSDSEIQAVIKDAPF